MVWESRRCRAGQKTHTRHKQEKEAHVASVWCGEDIDGCMGAYSEVVIDGWCAVGTVGTAQDKMGFSRELKPRG